MFFILYLISYSNLKTRFRYRVDKKSIFFVLILYFSWFALFKGTVLTVLTVRLTVLTVLF